MNKVSMTSFLLNIYIDKELKFSEKVTNKQFTFRHVKNIIIDRFEIFSVNYTIEAYGKDYTNYDNSELVEVFNGRSLIDLYITSSRTFTLSRAQKVLMTYVENKEEFIIFNFQTKALYTKIPQKSSTVKFEKGMPYNSRHCNYKKDNKLYFSGGIDHYNLLYEYDYDLNYLTQIQVILRSSYQCHSMLTYGDYIYIIGGYNNKSCDSYNIREESVNKEFTLPDLNYDRTDPGLCVVNHEYLIVFAGYSIIEKDHMSTIERIKLYNPVDYYSSINLRKCNSWELLPIYTPGNSKPYKRSNMAMLSQHGNQVLLLGGMGIGVVKDESFVFDFRNYTIGRSLYELPFELGFGEKTLVTDDGKNYYGFNYAANKLLRINTETIQCFEIEVVV